MTTNEYLFNLKLGNEYLFDYLLPSIESIKSVPKTSYPLNTIKHRKLIVYAAQGEGKTELVRSLVEEIVRKYGINNVNPIISVGDLESVLLYGLNKKLIQVHFIDDFTMVKHHRDVLRAYFRIRHIWNKLYGLNCGYILSIFGLHRFHSSAKEIRSTADVVIVKNDSLNPYDHSIVKRFVGENGLEDLHLIEEYKDTYPDLKSYSIYCTKTQKRGLLFLPLAKTNYLINIKDLVKDVDIIEKIWRRDEILRLVE